MTTTTPARYYYTIRPYINGDRATYFIYDRARGDVLRFEGATHDSYELAEATAQAVTQHFNENPDKETTDEPTTDDLNYIHEMQALYPDLFN